MNLRRSPTLDLAASVEAARGRGERAFSLSTPSFEDRAPELDLDGAATLLPPALGLAALRTRARESLFGKWRLPTHDLMITAGAKAAIFAALRVACRPGDPVLIVAPYWPSYADLARLLYLEPVIFETRFEEGFAVDATALAAAAERHGARAVLLSNPNNPTGRILPAAELGRIAEVARARQLLLLIDESFSGVVFDPAAWQASVCPADDRLVVVNSFSKSHHLQGLRVGACCASSALIDDIAAAHQTVASAAASLSQAAVLALLERDAGVPDLRPQRNAALAFVRAQGWPCLAPDGTFYLFPRVEDAEAFEARARARNVFLLRGAVFGRAYGDHLRLCFGRPMAELEEILGALRHDPAERVQRA